MKKGDYISAILRSKKTVFSFKDIVLLWGDSGNAARVRVNYYLKNGDLYRIRQGLYAKDKNYDKFELATRIFTPAYVSFETILGQAGIAFQYYNQIFIASYLTRNIVCDDQAYSFKKIKNAVLINKAELENKGEYLTASKERAFLDTIYINKDYHFDNLSILDWDKVFEILPIYNNQRMAKKVK
ncbi:MAG: type IV toxin-antitoxin system AbiEi family antitoxin domain-containing protein, partial [bacterium]|nr:type IV toxin-antitoxin system AbiEi family antitoxin domain-containing protein [bacterium]